MCYQLVESLATEQDTGRQIKLYGIIYGNPAEEMVYNFLELTSQKHLVEQLIDFCTKGKVTEVTLGDIVEDFLAVL